MFKENKIDSIVELLLSHSCPIQKGDIIIVEGIDTPPTILNKLVEKIFCKGAIPVLWQKSNSTLANYAKFATKEAYQLLADQELALMYKAKYFIGIRTSDNGIGIKDLQQEKLALLLENFIKPVHYEYRNYYIDWVYLRNPSIDMMHKSAMMEEEFINYYTEAILIDYLHLDILLDPLKERLENAKKVHIKGPNKTDLCFELGGVGVYKSVGRHNLPDGEIFTAPIKDSVNGIIEINIPSTYYGTMFEDIILEFANGKVIDCNANNREKLIALLNADEGARFVGEFALGVNPKVTKPINDILFDEKMIGSLHIALGNAYPVADNSNRSSIHWDLILNQTPAYGGGEIYFDNELIRKDGLFLMDDLIQLNFLN